MYEGTVHHIGCGQALMYWLEQKIDMVGFSSLGVTVLQVSKSAVMYHHQEWKYCHALFAFIYLASILQSAKTAAYIHLLVGQ